MLGLNGDDVVFDNRLRYLIFRIMETPMEQQRPYPYENAAFENSLRRVIDNLVQAPKETYQERRKRSSLRQKRRRYLR